MIADELEQLRDKVKVLEQHEADFGQKRAKFKEIYMQKESMAFSSIDFFLINIPCHYKGWNFNADKRSFLISCKRLEYFSFYTLFFVFAGFIMSISQLQLNVEYHQISNQMI